MKTSSLNRRRFLQTGLLGSTAVAATHFTSDSFAALTKTPGDPFHSLKMGVTSYTWLKFPLDQAIAMTKQVGVKYISLKDAHLPLKSTPEQRHEVHKKLEDAGLTLMGGGVIYFKNNEEEIQNVFEYAKDAGMATIVCSPEPDALDAVEKMVKKYDLKIAIHNHGPTDKKYPSPLDVMRMVKDRDPRMGVCMDVGHTVRIGLDPISAIEQCASRLYEFHMKDVTTATPQGKATEVGKGVIDIVGVLKALVNLKWPYHVALEYEVKTDNPLPGVIESFAYMRGVLATI
jgi:sugar phosphate isomerase/epimerase